VLGARVRSPAELSGVKRLNAVVWEVEDLCHTWLGDGVVTAVFYEMISPLRDVRIDNM